MVINFVCHFCHIPKILFCSTFKLKLKKLIQLRTKSLAGYKLCFPFLSLSKDIVCLIFTHVFNIEFTFQRELLIPVDKLGAVTDLLDESRKFLPIKPSDKLRLVEIASYKIHRIVPNGTSLDTLVQQTPKSYRIEVKTFLINNFHQFSWLEYQIFFFF